MFDDQVGNWDESFKYYFDVILKPFSKFMLKAIEKIRPLEIKAICPGHGPILRSHWKRYVDLSEEYAQQALDMPGKNAFIFLMFLRITKQVNWRKPSLKALIPCQAWKLW